jgi:hypothetical protein
MDLVELYRDGKSINNIAEIIGFGYEKTRKLLLKEGVVFRPKGSWNREHKSLHSIDVDYFKYIDTGEKAYWLGVLVSDGNISRDGNKVSLASKDLDLINKFREAIKSTHAVSLVKSYDKRTDKTYERYTIQVASKEFASNLIDKGVTCLKSYSCFYPKIDDALNYHFIRGLFDGDGCLMVKNSKNCRVSFIGTLEIINSIQLIFKNDLDINPHPIYKVTDAMNVVCTNYFSETKIIMNKLYDESLENIRLDRKYVLYEKIKNG